MCEFRVSAGLKCAPLAVKPESLRCTDFDAVGRVGLEPTTYGLKERRDGVEFAAVQCRFLLPRKGFWHLVEPTSAV
jgi:hypothetical protein